MQPHEWEKQEKLLEKIEKQKIENCLIFNTFAYEKHEWDNIPGIVPRYIIYLSKYMNGICEVCNDFYQREHVNDLRNDLQNKLQLTNGQIDFNRQTDIQEKTDIKLSIQNLEEKTDDFRNTYDNFTKEATKLDEQNCNGIYLRCMEKTLSTRGKDDYDGSEENLKDRNQLRMYSMKQLFNIFTTTNNQSQMHDRMCASENNIEQIFDNIKKLREDNKNLKTYADTQMDRIREQMKDDKKQQGDANDKFQMQIDENKTILGQHKDILGKINQEIKSMKTFSDQLQNSLKKCYDRVDNQRTDTHQLVQATKEDLKDRLGDLDKMYSEQLEEMTQTIEAVRIMARDSVNAKEKELTDLMEKNMTKIQTCVDENIEDMVEERKATLQKYEKQFNQIKLVCCKYFERYDIELESVKLKAKNVMDKYQDWSKVLVEPASLNDARLFSLESRIHEEEEMRITEFDYLKEAIKKLIYSIEQNNLSQIEMKQSQSQMNDLNNISKSSPLTAGNKSSSFVQKTPILPNLLNNQSLQNTVRDNTSAVAKLGITTMNDSINSIAGKQNFSGQAGGDYGQIQSQNKSSDIIMLKRLNYLRNSLETHDSRETTHHLRDQANRKKEERMLELWKNDLEKPSIYEQVQQMQKKYEIENQQSNKFLQILNSIQPNEGFKITGYNTNRIMGDTLNSIESTGNNNYFAQNNLMDSSQNESMSKTGQKRWNSRPKNQNQLKPIPKSQMTITIQQNLQKGKFMTTGDQELIANQQLQKKFKPIKQRIDEAEREKFWSEFSAGIEQNQNMIQPQRKQDNFQNYQSMNIINNNVESSIKYPQMLQYKNSVTVDTSNIGQFEEEQQTEKTYENSQFIDLKANIE